MKTTLRTTALAALLGAATMNTHAGVLTTDGVTFTSSWSGNVLTLEIDAAGRSGGWSTATGLAALAIKDVGTYSSVNVSTSLNGTSGWTVSTAELNASGCAGGGKGATSNRLCFSGKQISLGDDMVFKFTFNGAGVTTTEPHVKVEFVDARGNKVGSLLSQTLPATTTASTGTTTAGTTSGTGSTTAGTGTTTGTGTTAPTGTTTAGTPSGTGNATAGTGTTTGSGSGTITASTGMTTAGAPSGSTTGASTIAGTKDNTTATTEGTPAGGTILPTSTASETGTVATPQGGPLGSSAPTPLPPAQDLPTTLPVVMTTPAQTTGGTANATGSAVPEPDSIALLLGGLGLMGLALRSRSRSR